MHFLHWKLAVFWLKFDWSLFPGIQLTISNSALVHLMAWRLTGDKPELMMTWFVDIYAPPGLNELTNTSSSSLEHVIVTSKWARWRSKLPASRLFTQPFIRAQIKENIKAPRCWPLCGEFPAQMTSKAENVSIWWGHHDIRQSTLGTIVSVDVSAPKRC